MPTYEYRCTACGEEFEKFQRMSDEPGAECPACGEAAQRRLSAGAGLLFKGSGFYITDYRSDSYRKAAKSESGAGGGGEPKAEGSGKPDKAEKKAESTPASKPTKASE